MAQLTPDPTLTNKASEPTQSPNPIPMASKPRVEPISGASPPHKAELRKEEDEDEENTRPPTPSHRSATQSKPRNSSGKHVHCANGAAKEKGKAKPKHEEDVSEESEEEEGHTADPSEENGKGKEEDSQESKEKRGRSPARRPVEAATHRPAHVRSPPLGRMLSTGPTTPTPLGARPSYTALPSSSRMGQVPPSTQGRVLPKMSMPTMSAPRLVPISASPKYAAVPRR
jgi:hypothetical protein